MKVITYPDLSWTAVAECTFCQAELLIEIGDIKYDQYFRSFHVDCAVCHTKVVPTMELPWYVKRAARKEYVGWEPGRKPQGL